MTLTDEEIEKMAEAHAEGRSLSEATSAVRNKYRETFPNE